MYSIRVICAICVRKIDIDVKSYTNTDKTDLTDNSLSVLSVLSVFKNKDLTDNSELFFEHYLAITCR